MESCNFFVTIFLIFIYIGAITAEVEDSPKVIGAIINVNTRIGREEKISMEIAIQTFNKSKSNKSNLDLHVLDSGGNPLQASAAANDLVKRYPVQAILGTETWEETVLVAEATKKAQVPILSFATPSITPPLTSVRFPFLVRMASNDSQQMRCVASIVGSYGWRRVIAIYEDDGYSTDSRVLSLLSEELHSVGSEIEHSLAFPQFSTLSDPKDFIHKELEKLNSKQSRVFIVVGGSLELVSHIVTEAKDVGFMGSHSVWITTNSVTDLFHSLNSSVMSSMQGIIGIRTHYPKSTPSFLQFSAEFRRKIKSEYPEEDKFEPGIYALRAYDIITTLTLALEKSDINNLPTTSTTLLRNILSSNFTGLSGEIQLHNMELSASANYEIVNVVGQSYNVLKYWSPEYGFSDNAIRDMSTQEKKNFVGNVSEGWSTNVLGGPVYWPGKLDRTPLGWVMPTDAKPMIIGVPGRTSFDKFVKVKNETNPTPEGFCIDVFKEALKVIGYELPHQFVPFYGLYDDMVDQIYLKNFDAVVGDITILSNRSNYVDFTQPYAESGLKMVVPVKTEEKAWLFVKPFSKKLWLVVGIVFIYTMFVVWFLEHRSNPDFRGSWKNQLSTAMWFTFSTLFFAHRENLRSNYTRLVMFVWLFTVFVVTAGYTASLTSMLTIKRLQPTVTDIQALRTNNAHVGCDGDSFIRKYLERVLHFRKENIINIGSQYDYPDAFKNKTIAAAFLELPYERVFLSTYANDYKDTGLQHRFGGLAFAFPKGSPMARDFSKAFLNLSEDGTLNRLDNIWFSSYSIDSNSDDNTGNQSLSLSNFWGLFLVTGLTSTVILLLYIIRLCANFRQRSTQAIDSDESVWKRLGTYYNNDQHHEPNRDQITPRRRDIEVLISSDGESLSEYSTPRRHRQPTIEMQENHNGDWDNQTRPLRLFNSFPGPDRRISDMNNHVSSEWQHIQHSMPL